MSKKIWLMALLLPVMRGSYVIAEGVLDDPEYVKAVVRLHEQQMTKYSDPALFRPEDVVTREEAAKFFVGYATKIALKTIDTSRYCSFSDLDQIDPTLKNDVLQACLLRIFKGNQGAFHPTQPMTKAEALTVLLRITETEQLDESGTPWWLRTYEIAKEKGYTKAAKVMDLDAPLSRYELALLLRRVAASAELAGE